MKKYFVATITLLTGIVFTASAQQQAGATANTKQTSTTGTAAGKPAIAAKQTEKREPKRVQMAKPDYSHKSTTVQEGQKSGK